MLFTIYIRAHLSFLILQVGAVPTYVFFFRENSDYLRRFVDFINLLQFTIKKSSVFIPATRAGKEFLESYFPGMVPDVE